MTPTLAEQTGMAFGNFQSQLSDLPEGALGETIPNFHNIEFRVEGFKESIARDSAGRLKDVQKLVEEILERAEVMCKAQQLYRAGRLPKRVTHCDTKVNNLLFDEQGKPLCVIDLDHDDARFRAQRFRRLHPHRSEYRGRRRSGP